MPDDAQCRYEIEIERALEDLVMNCPELTALEAALSRFNLFRVLRADQHEIRHSNMLAWLLNPDEGHGLGALFLRRWLMRVVHDAGREVAERLNLPSPIEVDALDIDYVEVARESENIDLLLVIWAVDGTSWVICAENKVESAQHSEQLKRYREVVESRYAEAERRLFIFLTKYDEEPEDPAYITTSYEVIEGVLRGCVTERSDLIGPEPRLLVSQYLELLAEDSVGESRTALLAQKIYRSHRKAIEYIIEHRRDSITEASHAMVEALVQHADELGIVMVSTHHKGFVRFIPSAWDVPQNVGGTASGANGRFVLCEVTFWPKSAELHLTVAKAPDEWADKVWARATTAPFKQESKQRPLQFVKPYKAKSALTVDALAELDIHERKAELLSWLGAELKKEQFTQAVEIIADLLQELKVT